LTAVPAIDAEIRVRCEQDRIGQHLGHPQETSVRQAHRNVRIFLEKFENGRKIIVQLERADEGTTAEQLAGAALPEM
jgi:hypothetical protein